MFNTSGILLNKSALEHNLAFLRQYFDKNVLISSVVKGNAYGHGIEQFIPLAEECGVKHFSVFNADEALRVLTSSTANPTIMIMGYLHNEEIEWAIRHNIEFYVFDLDRLKCAIDTAKEMKKPACIHIELETGMNRTGFNRDELEEAIELMQDNRKHLKFKGLCTHFAGAESIANYLRIKKQKRRFRELQKWFIKNDLRPEKCHTACSAASMAYPETIMDMVRIGILQYGFWPSKEVQIEYLRRHQDDAKQQDDPLRRIISWKSRVMNTKKVKTGEFVGYGTSFLAQTDLDIAIVPIGYANGFTRSLSNTGRAIVNHKRVSVIGTVNMNCIALDVTGCKVKKGDEVILIGQQGELEISVASFGELSTQLNYELLTRLPQDIPRVVVRHAEENVTYPPVHTPQELSRE